MNWRYITLLNMGSVEKQVKLFRLKKRKVSQKSGVVHLTIACLF